MVPVSTLNARVSAARGKAFTMISRESARRSFLGDDATDFVDRRAHGQHLRARRFAAKSLRQAIRRD
jgi:hypothetical protein